jgi:hypothetical protein
VFSDVVLDSGMSQLVNTTIYRFSFIEALISSANFDRNCCASVACDLLDSKFNPHSSLFAPNKE